jgi:hypothetical protein
MNPLVLYGMNRVRSPPDLVTKGVRESADAVTTIPEKKSAGYPTPLMSYPQWCLRRRVSTVGDTANAAEKNSLKSAVPERRC